MVLPYKLVDRSRHTRVGVVANSFEALREKARKEFGYVSVNVVLESDGTEIRDHEYFETIEPNTVLMILQAHERWVSTESTVDVRPATVELQRVDFSDESTFRPPIVREEKRVHFSKQIATRVMKGRKTSAVSTRAKKSVKRREISPTVTLISRRSENKYDKRDFCLYCSMDVTHFSRHLFRKHPEEAAVVSIMTEPVGSKSRKAKLDALRKRGNYTLAVERNVMRPKQRGRELQSELVQDFVPCPNCKGIYRVKWLNRHVKTCTKSVKNQETEGTDANVEGTDVTEVSFSVEELDEWSGSLV